MEFSLALTSLKSTSITHALPASCKPNNKYWEAHPYRKMLHTPIAKRLDGSVCQTVLPPSDAVGASTAATTNGSQWVFQMDVTPSSSVCAVARPVMVRVCHIGPTCEVEEPCCS
jgi:hypothetical protein